MGNLTCILTKVAGIYRDRNHQIICFCLTIFKSFKVIHHKQCLNSRSSHQRCSIEKAVFKNFAIFTGKHLCWSLLLIDLRALRRPATFLKRDSNTGKHLCWSPFLRKLQVLKPANLLKGEYCKIFKNTILVKICEQLLLQFLLLTVNISFWVLVSALNSIGLLQRSSSRFKKFSLGCLVVYSSFI